MIPVAEAISNAPSVASIPALPTKWRRAGSHSPSEAEITCGFCLVRSGAVSARNVSAALGLVSNTLIDAKPGAAASSTSRSSVDSPPGLSSRETPTPNVSGR